MQTYWKKLQFQHHEYFYSEEFEKKDIEKLQKMVEPKIMKTGKMLRLD